MDLNRTELTRQLFVFLCSLAFHSGFKTNSISDTYLHNSDTNVPQLRTTITYPSHPIALINSTPISFVQRPADATSPLRRFERSLKKELGYRQGPVRSVHLVRV